MPRQVSFFFCFSAFFFYFFFVDDLLSYPRIWTGLYFDPNRDRIGYLVCCQQTMSRFGNRRFQKMSQEYMDDNVLHVIVTEMHIELLVLSSGKRGSGFTESDKSLLRTFPHRNSSSMKKLEISASLLRNHPAISLFVSRVIRQDPMRSPSTSHRSRQHSYHRWCDYFYIGYLDYRRFFVHSSYHCEKKQYKKDAVLWN
jgi:hypothetical protein